MSCQQWWRQLPRRCQATYVVAGVSRPETGAPPLVPKRELPNWKGELTGNGSSWHPRRAPRTGLGNVQQWRRQVAVRLGSRRENGGHGPLLPLAEAYGRLCRTHPFRPMAQGGESACVLRFANGSHYSLAHRPWRVAGRWGGVARVRTCRAPGPLESNLPAREPAHLGRSFSPGAFAGRDAGGNRSALKSRHCAPGGSRLVFSAAAGGRPPGNGSARVWTCPSIC